MGDVCKAMWAKSNKSRINHEDTVYGAVAQKSLLLQLQCQCKSDEMGRCVQSNDQNDDESNCQNETESIESGWTRALMAREIQRDAGYHR